jgi:hypothetical protein
MQELFVMNESDELETIVEAWTRLDEVNGQRDMESGAYSMIRPRCPRCFTVGMLLETEDGYSCEGCNRELERWEMDGMG